ncbi:Imm21 family immunity protein [Kitasatospora sp. NPDC051914]|uniref:Imm21 family immunity protein n=1 Tax=Kitasatospora sp. NPDC051914 TaxID=3154945 RepID=UPI003421E0FA
MTKTTDWLDGTDFGYYALCPEHGLAGWDGTEANEVFQEFVGRIELPDGSEVLTIGGEALPVLYLPEDMTFVQCHGSDDDTGLREEVERAVEAPGWQDAVEITLGGQYRLIDSGVPGADTEEEYSIRVDIPHGRYRVRTLFVDTSAGMHYLHRLVAL